MEQRVCVKYPAGGLKGSWSLSSFSPRANSSFTPDFEKKKNTASLSWHPTPFHFCDATFCNNLKQPMFHLDVHPYKLGLERRKHSLSVVFLQLLVGVTLCTKSILEQASEEMKPNETNCAVLHKTKALAQKDK